MDSMLTTLIGNLPNLAIAIWVIFSYQQTIKSLLESQQKMLDQLMALHPPQDVEKESIRELAAGDHHKPT